MNNRRKIVVATAVSAALFCTVCVSYAQNRTDEYGYRPDYTADDDYAPAPATDTTLFYNYVKQADDLYAAMAGHRLAFVHTRRRNAPYGRSRVFYSGLQLPARYRRMIRAVGGVRHLAAPTDALTAAGSAGVEEYTFLPTYAGKVSTAGVTFTDKGYTAGVTASVAAAFGRGWEFDAAVEGRTGRDLHIDGVFTSSAGITARIAKQISDVSEFSLILTANPTEQGLRSASSDEAYALTGNRLYNPSWGWQNGRQRNSRVRREMMPSAIAACTTAIGSATSFTAAVAVEAGRTGRSALGWYDAATPMPDNYRCMPSYFTNPVSAQTVAEAWRSGDARYTQIDWEELYRVNRMSDRGAVYALEERVRRTTGVQAAVSAVTTINDGLRVSYGIRAQYGSQRSYRQMRDLLGASSLTDIDYYIVDDDSYSDARQNDLRNPDRMVGEGDRFGYDYALRRLAGELWAAAEYASGRFDLAFAGRLGGETAYRYGYFEKELFPGSGSYGPSEKMNFTTFGAALTLGWAFTPQYRLCVSLHAAADAPDATDLFFNPQYNNRTTGDGCTERTFGAEAGLRTATQQLQLQASLFAESRRGGIRTERYYDDLAVAFCDMSVSGIDILSYGIEAAATVSITRRWYAEATATAMQCRYTSDPTVRVVTDRANIVVDPGSAAHMGGCVPDGAARLAASAAIGYRSRNGWQLCAAGAWVGARRVEPSAVRRTERVAYQGSSSPEAFGAITRQEPLPDAVNIDLRVVKRWFTGRNSRITASLTVSNLLGERGNVWSAYESPRVRRISRGIQTDYTPLPTRILYASPRSVLLAATYTF